MEAASSLSKSRFFFLASTACSQAFFSSIFSLIAVICLSNSSEVTAASAPNPVPNQPFFPSFKVFSKPCNLISSSLNPTFASSAALPEISLFKESIIFLVSPEKLLIILPYLASNSELDAKAPWAKESPATFPKSPKRSFSLPSTKLADSSNSLFNLPATSAFSKPLAIALPKPSPPLGSCVAGEDESAGGENGNKSTNACIADLTISTGNIITDQIPLANPSIKFLPPSTKLPVRN